MSAKKKTSVLQRHISTKMGTLFIIYAALPVVLFAYFYIQSDQQPQKSIEGISSYSATGYMQPGTTSEGSGNAVTNSIFKCPPGAMCYPFPSNFPSPNPSITCTPPPPCLKFGCLPPVPPGGWCQTSPTPVPSVSPTLTPTPPPGCYYRKICLMEATGQVLCRLGDPNCQTCRFILICPNPSITPPQISCPPVPSCDPRKGILCESPCWRGNNPSQTPISQPATTSGTGQTSTGQTQNDNPFFSFLTGIFRGFFAK